MNTLVSIRKDGDIAIVTLDNPPVNAISAAVRKGLWQAADEIDADPELHGAVLICAGRTFIAGADVREFGQLPEPPHLPDLVTRIEAARAPWFAAIHGAALGGGFEIAMGCRFRVATERAKVGLPEVNLGIIPGASGTVRTPRLAGVEVAVDLVTSGKTMAAPKACKTGLIDAVIEGNLEAGALAFARSALAQPLPAPISQRPIAPVGDDFWTAKRKLAAKPGHRAPLEALEALRRATELPFEAALEAERASFLALRESDEAAALRAVFFAERAALRPEALRDVTPCKVAQVGVVGGGLMGAGIASALRRAGLPVVLIERDDAALARGIENIAKTFAGAIKRGKLKEDARDALMAGVSGASDYRALAACDLVIEAVFEDLCVKREVFEHLTAQCHPDAILATNTSYIDPRAIFAGMAGAERFIGLHFFSPAQIMKLLEIVPLPETACEVQATAFALAKQLNKVPVRAGICEGFIGNRILKRYRAEAETLVRRGVAIAQVDGAMRGYGFRMGPFEAQDLGGLDIAYLQREGARTAGQDVPDTLGDILVRAGRKGQKTGGGWYDYAQGDRTPQPSPQVASLLVHDIAPDVTMSDAQIAKHLVGAMADEGQSILSEGIAHCAADIDLVEIHGYGFPRWKGGPMFATGHRDDVAY